jgi:Domain of unknown function (DUF5658)
LKSQSKYSCWYNRLQGLLYLMAFLTFGLGDTLSSLWMFQHQGILRETNPILRYILLNFGASNYWIIKIWLTLVILFMIFWIQIRSNQPIYWTVNGCLISLIISGLLAIALNIQAGRNEALFLSTEDVIVIFLIMVYTLTSIGEEIDKLTHPKIRSYVGCLLNDLMIILVFISKIFKRKTEKQLFWPAEK